MFAQRFYATGAGANTLLVVEHKDGAITGATLNALTAASKLGGSVTALVAGGDDAIAQSIAKYAGVSKVLTASDAAYSKNLPEDLAPLLAEVTKSNSFTHVFAGHTAVGKNVLPRVAALLDVAAVSDITGIESEDTFVRPIYAGNAIATVKSNDNVKIVTVRGTAFEAAQEASSNAAVEAAPEVAKSGVTEWVGEEIQKSDRPDLGTANRVISGGRGMKNGENFKLLYDMADKMGAAVGASRAAVDAGFVDNSLQVGQTGKIVAPGN